MNLIKPKISGKEYYVYILGVHPPSNQDNINTTAKVGSICNFKLTNMKKKKQIAA